MDAGVIVGIVAVVISAVAVGYSIVNGRTHAAALKVEAKDRRESIDLLRLNVEAQLASLAVQGAPRITIEKAEGHSSFSGGHEFNVLVLNDGGVTAAGLEIVAFVQGQEVGSTRVTVKPNEQVQATIRIPRGDDPTTGDPLPFPTGLTLEARYRGDDLAVWSHDG